MVVIATALVTQKRMITVPADVMRYLNGRPGDFIAFVQEGQEILIKSLSRRDVNSMAEVAVNGK